MNLCVFLQDAESGPSGNRSSRGKEIHDDVVDTISATTISKPFGRTVSVHRGHCRVRDDLQHVGGARAPSSTPTPGPAAGQSAAPAERAPAPADLCDTPTTTDPTATTTAPPATTTTAIPTPACDSVPAPADASSAPRLAPTTTSSTPALAPAPAAKAPAAPAPAPSRPLADAPRPAAPAADEPVAPDNDDLSSKTAEPDPDWAPTENPNAAVVPGEMRSDREEIPAPFTKEDADKAETMEARQRMSRAAFGCQTYWPSPFEVCGLIRDKYNSLGGPGSFLSFPSTGELTNPGNTGKRSQFLNGPIYWSPATGAHPVVNSFLNRWGLNQYETGRLKYPTTDEIVLPDGGRRQEFQDGVIYVAFQNAVGSALLNGPLRNKYNSMGGLAPGSSSLGYPIQDQILSLPDGRGQMVRLQFGVIYWHPVYGAHPVTGVILDVWALSDYETGTYGYPIADQTGSPTSVSKEFQNDDISYSLENPVAVRFYDCKLNTEWPHVSHHNYDRINVVTTGTCTDPKLKVRHETILYGFSNCNLLANVCDRDCPEFS